MAGLEELVLSAIEEDVLAPDVVEASIARALELHATEPQASSGDAERIARELATLDRELQRLTALAAAGGSDIPTVLEALRTRQERRRALTAAAPQSLKRRQRARSAKETEAALRSRFADVKALLRRNVPYSRPVLESLLAGRIALRPHENSPTSAPVFDVRIPLTTRGIFEGICCPNGVASPAGGALSGPADDKSLQLASPAGTAMSGLAQKPPKLGGLLRLAA